MTVLPISFQLGIFYFLSDLMRVRTSTTMLNRTGEGKHLCLVLDVSGRVKLYFCLFFIFTFLGLGNFFWSYRVACRILVPQPGIEPGLQQ